MARVQYRDRDDAFDDADRAIFDRLESERKMPTPNIFRALAHAPLQLDGLLTYAKSLRSATELGSDLRELVILALAQSRGGDYVASHHTTDALRAGYTLAQLHAITDRDALSAHFDPTEIAVIEFGYAAGSNERFESTAWNNAAHQLSDRQMVQLTMTACWYVSGVLMMDILDLDLEEDREDSNHQHHAASPTTGNPPAQSAG